MSIPKPVRFNASLFFLCFFIFSCCLIFSFELHAQEEQDVRNSIEFSPQVSVGVFTAQNKLTGTAYGGELIYHMNTVANPRPWMKLLNLKSLDLVFNYKNMNDI